MVKKPADIDSYISMAPAYAQPVLTWFRRQVHAAIPGLQEALKWGHPAFLRKDGSLFFVIAAHKHHCRLGFWRHNDLVASLDREPELRNVLEACGRISSEECLPAAKDFKKLAKLADQLPTLAKKTGARKHPPKKPLLIPEDFKLHLEALPAARDFFQKMSPSHQREYLEWILEAKKTETRQRRIEKALTQLGQGKDLNHLYH